MYPKKIYDFESPEKMWKKSEDDNTKIVAKGMIFGIKLDLDKFTIKYEMRNHELSAECSFNLPMIWKMQNVEWLKFGLHLPCASLVKRVGIIN